MKCCFRDRSRSPDWSENEIASNSGRFVLSELRRRNSCLQVGRINPILALAGLAGKRARSNIKLTTALGLVAASFDASVDAHRRRIARIEADAIHDEG